VTIEKRNLDNAAYEQGGPVVVGGLVIHSRQARGSDAVLNAMYRWEFDGFRNRCRDGDATSCMWEGLAYHVGVGTRLDTQVAHLRYARACSAQVLEACALDMELRKQLRNLCREGFSQSCLWLNAINAR